MRTETGMVAADRFWMDTRPATVADFRRFVTATSYQPVAERPMPAAESPAADPSLLAPGSVVIRRAAGPVDRCDPCQREPTCTSTEPLGFRCVIESGPLLARPGWPPARHHSTSVQISGRGPSPASTAANRRAASLR